MSNQTANKRLPYIFWQVWKGYWSTMPEGEVPLVFVKTLMDGDFVCMAPIHHDKMAQAMVGLKNDPKFVLFEYGDWAFPRENFFGIWSAFIVSARHEFWEAVAKFDSINGSQSGLTDDGVSHQLM